MIVPVRDGASTLAACLDGVASAAASLPGAEVVVVDDRSRDASAGIARAHPVVTAVVDGPGRGSYAARNVGIAACRATSVAFTDADAVPRPDWLVEGLAALDHADLAGGAVVQTLPAAASIWSRYDAATYLDQERFVTSESFAATVNLFARRGVFDAVGLFDGGLRSSGDWEWCRRAVGAGFSIAYAPGAVVDHRVRAGAAELWRQQRRLGAGWRELARRGDRPVLWRDPAMRWQLAAVVDAAARLDVPPRRRSLAAAHVVALSARWAGRLTAI